MRRALAAIHRRSVAGDVLGLNVSGADLVLVYAVSELEFASAMQEFAVISPAVRLGRIPTSEDLELLAERLAARPESP